MMKPISQHHPRILVGTALAALLLSACGSSATEDTGSGLASLTDETAVTETTAAPEPTEEEAVLEFADCMRENGIPDFQDPIINADGSVEFLPPPGAAQGEGISDDVQDAIDACFGLLEGVALGPGGSDVDFDQLQDDLLLLAQCLRDNGLDADDPNISAGFGGNQADGPSNLITSPFGENVDINDPKVIGIIEDCAEKLDLAGPGGPGAAGGAG
jgi:hypothetical protein